MTFERRSEGSEEARLVTLQRKGSPAGDTASAKALRLEQALMQPTERSVTGCNKLRGLWSETQAYSRCCRVRKHIAESLDFIIGTKSPWRGRGFIQGDATT